MLRCYLRIREQLPPEIGEFGGEPFLIQLDILQMNEGTNNSSSPVSFIAQDIPRLLEPGLAVR